MAPLFSIWVGTGAQFKMAVSLSISLFAIVVDSVLLLRSADHTMRASLLQILFKILRQALGLPAFAVPVGKYGRPALWR